MPSEASQGGTDKNPLRPNRATYTPGNFLKCPFTFGPALSSVDRDGTLLASSSRSDMNEVVYLKDKMDIGHISRTLHSSPTETYHNHVVINIRTENGRYCIQLGFCRYQL